jgi:hypothetical protein
MAEPYFPGGPVPQGLGKTLEDFKRLGKGLLVGETADILGLPADLTGLYYDVKYGQTPAGIQSLIDRYGSEALAKTFMGKDFPEFSFDNIGKDENLESAGRALAPGALLTKAIATARLASRTNKYPPNNGGGGYALATAGGDNLLNPLNDVPETVGERLYMTQGFPDGGQSKKVKAEDPFFDELTPDPDARLTPTGSVFSNLLNELGKVGDESSKLSVRKPKMRPELDKDGRVVKDNRGRAIVKETGEFEIKGIDFTKKPTGEELLGYFKNALKPEFGKKFGGEGLKDSGGVGLQSRLGKEAIESGLIRYLELNPKEVMTKEKVINLASLFKPEIKMNTYSGVEQAELSIKIRDLETRTRALPDNDPSKPALQRELKEAEDKMDTYNDHNPWSYTGIQELKVQDMSRSGGSFSEQNQDLVKTDNFTFLFSGDDGQQMLLGKKADASSANTVDKMIAEVDDYFKAMGETTSLKQLLPGKKHGYRVPNYQGHIRASAMDTIDPVTGRKYKTLSINEIQSNQAGDKGLTAVSQDPRINATIKELIDKRNASKSNVEGDIGNLTNPELEKLNRLLRSSGRMDKNTSMRSFFQALDEGATLGDNDILGVPRVMTNKTRMDALQIVKEDKKLGTGFVNLAEEKAILQRQAESSSKIAEEARNELTTLSNASKDAKRAFFETDLRLNRDKILLADFKKAKEQIIKDLLDADTGVSGVRLMDRDANMSPILASMFYKNSRTSQGEHLPTGRGLDEEDMSKVLNFTGPERTTLSTMTDEQLKLDTVKKASKARYGTQGDVDILSEILTDKNTEVAYQLRLFDLPFGDPTLGRKVIISDIDMMRDYYADLTKMYQEGKLGTPGTSGPDGAFNSLNKTNVSYQDYIRVKSIANGPDYFKDRANAEKTLRYLMNDRERKIEASLIKTEIFNKVMNNPKVTQLMESDNIIEIKDRLASILKDKDANKGGDGVGYYSGEHYKQRRKVFDDLLTDFGLESKGDLEEDGLDNLIFSLEELKGRSPIAAAFAKAGDEVYDEYSKTLKKIPVLRSGSFYNTLTPQNVGSKSNTKILPGQTAFTRFFKTTKLWDEKEFNKKLSNRKRETINDAFDTYVKDNFIRSSTIIESSIAKKGLEQFKKDKEYLETKLSKAEALEQDSMVQLEDFNRDKDLDQILENLRDKLPDDLKKTLEDIIKHQKSPNNSFETFKINPPVLDYGQMTELMAHNVIKKAKEMGFERVVFPSMDAYDDVGQRGYLRGRVQRKEYGDLDEKKAYDFAIGEPLSKALKKYGQGYITANEVIAAKTQGRVGNARVGKKQEIPNAIDDDLHRIVDLTIEEASKKADSNIPRMAKGGIFSKFRKAS